MPLPLARQQLFRSIAYFVTLMAVSAASRLDHFRLARHRREQLTKVPRQLTPNFRVKTSADFICWRLFYKPSNLRIATCVPNTIGPVPYTFPSDLISRHEIRKIWTIRAQRHYAFLRMQSFPLALRLMALTLSRNALARIIHGWSRNLVFSELWWNSRTESRNAKRSRGMVMIPPS